MRAAHAAGGLLVGLALLGVARAAGGPAPIRADRTFQVLVAPTDPEVSTRAALHQAGVELGDWSVDLAGVALTGPRLVALAETDPGQPVLRVVREGLGRPVDLDDLLYFLDDVLVAGRAGRRGEPFHVNAGRARSAGILVHPDEVFRGRSRDYGASAKLAVDEPSPPAVYAPAEDGEPPGPRWTARFLNPLEERQMLDALVSARPASDFGLRVRSLIDQVRAQGGECWVGSTLRNRERGFLMWGAWRLSRAGSEAEVRRIIADLDETEADWELDIPIAWAHPDGWKATVEASRRMADTYDVVYATRRGARESEHYDGVAVDLVAWALPRRLHLVAPDGASATFDLSDPTQTRDLNLTEALIEWIEEHFAFRKLRSDYPHWEDAAPKPRSQSGEGSSSSPQGSSSSDGPRTPPK